MQLHGQMKAVTVINLILFCSLATLKRRLQRFGIQRTQEVEPAAVINLVKVHI